MSQVKSDLNSKFNTQNLDPVKQILDMEITRDKTTKLHYNHPNSEDHWEILDD